MRIADAGKSAEPSQSTSKGTCILLFHVPIVSLIDPNVAIHINAVSFLQVSSIQLRQLAVDR